ncbi:acyltransferase family protein [Demequina subtropica]|uniref:acyltransferase family protein n=1 Tax=Demequina subtropica TaxID=1638989 RepID=UPI00078224F8|nr:acyltransferase [Demequina subtropica]
MSTSLRAPVNAVGRFAHVDALRAFAVLVVVGQHVVYRGLPGESGVTVFFGISGFIITWLMLREKSAEGGFRVGAFYFRRIVKLAPPFLVIILVPTLVYGLVEPVAAPAVLSQVFFGYNWLLIFDPLLASQVLPGTIVVWSLAVEEQFYIAFALIWLAVARTRAWLEWALGVAVAAIVTGIAVRIVLVQDPAGYYHARWGTDARMDAIGIGVLAAVALFAWQRGSLPWLARLAHPATPAVAVALYCGSLLIAPVQWELTVAPILQVCGAVLLILYGLLPRQGAVAGAFDKGVSWRPLQLVGLASYSIYLIHYPLGTLIGAPLEAVMPKVLANLATGVIAVLAGVAVYRLVEVPALAWRKRRERARAARSAHVAAGAG